MPAKPIVCVKVTNYRQVRAPLNPCQMAPVQMLAEFDGLQGWHVLTLPETDWLPVEAGKTLGYPKYVVDSLQSGGAADTWDANVINEGENALSLSLHFQEDKSQASWFERLTSSPPLILLRKSLPSSKEKPMFLTMPVDGNGASNQALLLRGEVEIMGLPGVREAFGKAHLSVKTNQPWAGLVPAEATTRGIMMVFSGELNLRHVPIGVVDTS